MSYDLLIIASDARSVTSFNHKDFEKLTGKYGMSAADWNDMVDAKAPRWTVDGTEMIFPAMDHYFANGRKLNISEAERKAYYQHRGSDDLRYLNGIFLADFCIRHGFSVEVINRLDTDYNQLEEMLALGPRAVAISSTFIPNRRRIIEIARWIKDRDRDVHVIVGGPLVRYSFMIHDQQPELAEHPMINALYFFQGNDQEPDPAIDALVVDARGEQTLVKILEKIRSGEDYRLLPNVACYDRNHRLTINPLDPEHLGVEEWQIDWENLDEKYLGSTVAMRGSIGCPMRCKFCSFVVLFPGWELKSVECLERELKSIGTRSFIKNICFTDDNVFLSRKDVNQYAKMMAGARLPFSWSGYVRISSITPENIRWFAESKCIGMSIGIESGDLQVLKNMRKVQNPDSILRSIELVNTHGISTASSFIVGFPGETEDTVGNTINLLNSFAESGPALNFYTAWVFAAIPLTPIDLERDRWKLKGYMCDWEHETMNVGEAHRQVQRFHKEVTRGAYIHYPYDDMALVASPDSHEKCLEALKLRHGLAVMDEYGQERFRGLTRSETLNQLEQNLYGARTKSAE